MKEDAIVAQIVSEIDTATASDVQVRTAGGDQDVSVPEVIIEWEADRLPEANGHTPYAAAQQDNNGYNTAREYHSYFQATVTCTVRFNDEIAKDQAVDNLHGAFIAYEDDATLFDPDTRQWDVGDTFTSDNPVVNPDWYETDYVISFQYMKRHTRDGLDAIEGINDVIDII